jgi:hypothetical protein
MDRVPVFETGSRGFESCRTGHNKEIVMKAMTFINERNGEQVVCNDTRMVETIDGVAYLVVHRPGTDRQFLMRKDALKKVNGVGSVMAARLSVKQ